jgi:zinc transporter 1/2/3
LIMALSLHHIFEGLALGLQHSVQRVFTLLLALMCHETIISFSLGLQFVKCGYSLKRILITTLLCSIIMPIGVTIGTILTELGTETVTIDMISGFLQAFAAGTFIFVTFFEILQEEIDPHDTSIGKIASVFLGFIVMALLTLIPDPSYLPPGGAPINSTLFHLWI